MNIQAFEYKSSEAAEFLGLLASPHRLRLLCHLVEGELSVGELAERTDLRQATASQHLALLRAHKIVATRREGTTVYYAIKDPAAKAILEALHEIYCKPRRRARA